jgi:hypothetical protein
MEELEYLNPSFLEGDPLDDSMGEVYSSDPYMFI